MTLAGDKKTGRHMLLIGWVILLGMLVAVFAEFEERKTNPNQNLAQTGPREIVLERNRYNHYVLTGQINGKEVTFFLDTGATKVSVPSGLAEELGLKPGMPERALTANGIVETRSTVIDSLTLGPIQLSDVHASINPGMHGDEILLGMSALKDLEFSQRGDQLTIRQI